MWSSKELQGVLRQVRTPTKPLNQEEGQGGKNLGHNSGSNSGWVSSGPQLERYVEGGKELVGTLKAD